MWNFRIGIICAVLLPTSISMAAEKKVNFDQIGRYQLVAGKLTHSTGSGGYYETTDAMYKLDTATGKLSLCYVSSKPGANGNIVMTRTCDDFERTWETAPAPPQPALK